MKIGYARTSTTDQQAGFDAQIRELEAAGCERIYAEQTSSVGGRPELDDALDYIRNNDTLVVTKLDRLARSVIHMGQIVERLQGKAAHLQILNMGVDTSNATGQLLLNVMASVAQFERSMMLERQREGIVKAQAEGRYKGRAPTARRQTEEVHKLTAEGHGPSAIAKALGIGRSSVYRILEGTSPQASSAVSR